MLSVKSYENPKVLNFENAVSVMDGGKQTLGSGADSVPRRTMRAANRGRSVVRAR
jgi:hypothetical protein